MILVNVYVDVISRMLFSFPDCGANCQKQAVVRYLFLYFHRQPPATFENENEVKPKKTKKKKTATQQKNERLFHLLLTSSFSYFDLDLGMLPYGKNVSAVRWLQDVQQCLSAAFDCTLYKTHLEGQVQLQTWVAAAVSYKSCTPSFVSIGTVTVQPCGNLRDFVLRLNKIRFCSLILLHNLVVDNKFLCLLCYNFSNRLDAAETAVFSDEAQLSHSATDEPEEAVSKKKPAKLRVTKKKELQSAAVCR